MEMLPLVQVVPEMNLTIDPSLVCRCSCGGAVIVSMTELTNN